MLSPLGEDRCPNVGVMNVGPIYDDVMTYGLRNGVVRVRVVRNDEGGDSKEHVTIDMRHGTYLVERVGSVT